jgi:hypothetical protein
VTSSRIHLGDGGRSEEPSFYRCSLAARWLPRVLAATVLVAAVLAAYRFDPHQVLSASRYLRSLLVVLGAALALWIVRKGGEVRTSFAVTAEELLIRHGSREYSLRLQDLDRLAYETPFAQSRTWLSALVLRDRFGQTWRVSAYLRQGDRFLEELLARTGRSDLRAWADTLRLREIMARADRRLLLGYGASVLILAAGLIYHFR